MSFGESIIMVPVYLLIAIIIWRVIRLDAWLKPLIDEYRTPTALEGKVKDLEARLNDIESKLVSRQ